MRAPYRGLLASLILLGFSPGVVFGQAQVLVAPTNQVGGALAEGITSTLIRRGFAANDPRIAATIAGVETETVAAATAGGAGATWITTAAEFSPYVVLGALAVSAGIVWYFDGSGKAYLGPPGSTSSTPVFSNGITNGALCWGISSDCFGSPQEALSYTFWNTQQTYHDATYGVPQMTQVSPTQYTATYNYSIPSLGLNNASGSKTITSHGSAATCPAGQGYVSSSSTGCVSAQLNSSPWAGAPLVGYALPTAFSNLPAAAQSAPLSGDLAAEVGNRLWLAASQQPGYTGVPFSSASPVTSADFSAYAAANPSYWPTTSALGGVVPTSGPAAVASPATNPNAVQPAASSVAINLGTDPGTPAPTLDDVPTDIFGPIKALFSGWLAWQVPSHSTTCPTWSATPSIAGNSFAINVTYHCTLASTYGSQIFAVAFVGWVVIAAFIVLSA